MRRNEVEKWDKKDIEEYQSRRRAHGRELKFAEMAYNGRFCGHYVRCRREVEKCMDGCQMLRNGTNRAMLLSTATLLQLGDRCIGDSDDSFTELYELAMERNNGLYYCLDKYHNQTDKSMDCSGLSTNHTHCHWSLVDSDALKRKRSDGDCLAEVNLVQFRCAQLLKCCPNFYRCQNEIFDAKVELRIALLTMQLIGAHHDCLRSQLIKTTQLEVN
ncbi:unnamed protein product [Litomosoides sigmodontis]|uniref:Uncharacterized protein n=1 Tax=Litomosoides sigmodontis TaxID=42156 RepID=A0A3P7K1L6_LITSI|nr:unnamed protein product [Litomosoides sigmodontis]